MKSMIDRLRSTTSTSTSVAVFGFDPDQDTVGWAMMLATMHTPARGPAQVREVHLGLIEADVRGTPLEKTELMIKAVRQWNAPPTAADVHAVFVEAQQVYAEEQSPQERVGKANDLLRLAQITGAIQLMAYQADFPIVQAVLPRTWKGNHKKHVTVSVLQERLPGVVFQFPHPLAAVPAEAISRLPKRLGHALDAAGIALYGIDQLALHGTQGAVS